MIQPGSILIPQKNTLNFHITIDDLKVLAKYVNIEPDQLSYKKAMEYINKHNSSISDFYTYFKIQFMDKNKGDKND